MDVGSMIGWFFHAIALVGRVFGASAFLQMEKMKFCTLTFGILSDNSLEPPSGT